MGIGDERRQYLRRPFELPVRHSCRLGEALLDAYTRDLSESGAFLLLQELPGLGEYVGVAFPSDLFENDFSHVPMLRAEVVRVEKSGVAVRFTNPAPAADLLQPLLNAFADAV